MQILFASVLICSSVLQAIHGQCLSEDDSLPLNIDPHIMNSLNDAAFNFSVKYFKVLVDSVGRSSSAHVKGNVFGSPYSVWQSLVLCYFGSEAETEEELSEVLGTRELGKLWTLGGFKLNNFLFQVRARNASASLLRIANRVYFDSREPVRECMKPFLQDDAQVLDFLTSTEESRELINSWVSEVTYRRIPELLPADLLKPSTRVVLVNAAYFKGKWQSRFKTGDTTKELFYVSPNEIVYVDMMTQKGTFANGLSEDLNSAVLQLPYEGDISMFIFLPFYIDNSLETLISRMTPERIREAIDTVQPSQLTVSIPKFKMEQTLDLTQSLKAMNITRLFDPSLANLSGFSEKPGLHISGAVHKSFILVDEEGSEAAAATALLMYRYSRVHDPDKFVANSPFVFLIYDHDSNVPLFMGVIVNPNNRN